MTPPAVAPAASVSRTLDFCSGGPWRLRCETPGTARRMHLLDVTMLYAPQSGGVVRYLRAKHAWLRRHTSVRHSLLVPGAADARGSSGEIFLRTRSLGHAHRWPLAVHRWSRTI